MKPAGKLGSIILLSALLFVSLVVNASEELRFQVSHSMIEEGLAEARDLCRSLPDVKKISVPKDYDKPSSPKMDYYFQFRQAKKSETRPTIVFLPGGPGGWSIWEHNLIDEDFDILYLDPRGMNCNHLTKQEIAPKELLTKHVARDVLQVLKQLKLENYIIHGHSYGTMWATFLGHYLQKEKNLTQPRAILFEGTMGHYQRGWRSYPRNKMNEVNKFFGTYPHLRRSFVRGDLLKIGFDQDFWLYWISGVGNEWRDITLDFKALRDQLGGGPEISFLDSLSAEANYFSEEKEQELDPDDPSAYVMNSVLCYEISRSFYTKTKMPYLLGNNRIQLDLNARFKNFCSNLPVSERLSQPFDSKKFQLSAPLIYINGSTDPQTPLWWAHYHYRNQKKTKQKKLISLKWGSHSPVGENKACRLEFFTKIFQRDFDFQDVLNKDGYCLNEDISDKSAGPWRLPQNRPATWPF